MELELKDGRVLEVKVSYDKGGINPFTGNMMRRGYTLHCTPVKIERIDGQLTSRSFIIGANPKDKGLASFLLEVKRASPKAQARADVIGASRINRVLAEWLRRSGCEFVEPLPLKDYPTAAAEEMPTELLDAVQEIKPVPVEAGIPRAMRMTQEELKHIGAIHSQAENLDPIVWVKFFQPWGAWTWYAYEYDGKDEFFGYVVGHECELGYFSLKELAALRGPMGLTIERDIHWRARPLSEVKKEHERKVTA